MSKARLRRIALALLAACFVPTAANAATTPARPHLNAMQQNVSCSVSMLPIQFGNVTTVWRTVPVIVTATCPSALPYEIRFVNAAGCGTVRVVSGVQIELLLPNGAAWCDGTNGTQTLQAVGTGAPQTFYGTARVVGDVTRVRAGSYQQPLELQLVPQQPL